MLTVSHCIRWNSNGTLKPFSFTPSYYGGFPGPFGTAHPIQVYPKRKITENTISWYDTLQDYAIVVLNTKIGNLTGWLGLNSTVTAGITYLFGHT